MNFIKANKKIMENFVSIQLALEAAAMVAVAAVVAC